MTSKGAQRREEVGSTAKKFISNQFFVWKNELPYELVWNFIFYTWSNMKT